MVPIIHQNSTKINRKRANFPRLEGRFASFFVYRVKFKFSVKRRNPNASPTGKMQFGLSSFGPSDWIRTSGLLNPIQARYQTSLHPDFILPRYHSTSGRNLQALFWLFSDFSRGRSDDGSGLRVGGLGVQIFARGREHELDTVELVDLGCAGVIVHGDDIGLGIGAAQGLDDALADDVVW